MSATKHTHGPLHVVIQDGDIKDAICFLANENEDWVARVTLPFPFDTNYNERNANAHRLALAWNCHDELRTALEALAAAIESADGTAQIDLASARAAIANAARSAA